jgi:hypothetical protein
LEYYLTAIHFWLHGNLTVTSARVKLNGIQQVSFNPRTRSVYASEVCQTGVPPARRNPSCRDQFRQGRRVSSHLERRFRIRDERWSCADWRSDRVPETGREPWVGTEPGGAGLNLLRAAAQAQSVLACWLRRARCRSCRSIDDPPKPDTYSAGNLDGLLPPC